MLKPVYCCNIKHCDFNQRISQLLCLMKQQTTNVYLICLFVRSLKGPVSIVRGKLFRALRLKMSLKYQIPFYTMLLRTMWQTCVLIKMVLLIVDAKLLSLHSLDIYSKQIKNLQSCEDCNSLCKLPSQIIFKINYTSTLTAIITVIQSDSF